MFSIAQSMVCVFVLAVPSEKKHSAMFRKGCMRHSKGFKPRSAQIGITVHGTHRSLVEGNIMWNVGAAGIYTEDGNEMFNTLSCLVALQANF